MEIQAKDLPVATLAVLAKVDDQTNMKPQVLLVTLAVLAVLATLPLGKGNLVEGRAALAEGTNARAWPCCDKCGLCLLMYPTSCLNVSERGCHPACRNCVMYTADSSSIRQEPPVYRCADMLTDFCKRRCTPAAAAAA
ncbi:Bowman-Birk type trypsin inhibitor-like [Panicum miliaceum]|uniref:Bowman-Birk type trypsin inhibitor-like n=1 Tax=Panicum miliaceum TaxID=4540 RepID=A0A3L6SH92_PANMI|nr:Bowman-Birk type trypsin inhibitor-like [Panicum miliaceum]